MLALGVSLEGPNHEGPPPLDALDPLLKAPQHAAYVSEVVREFGYRQHHPADSEIDLGEEIRSALKSPAEVLIVHLVAHGRLADTGERGLHVVGVDGSNLDDPVSSWISLIESHPDKPRPLTLFILDLCHSGVAATLPWHQEMPAGRRRAWVIAATGSQDRAFDYRLSRATRTVLGNYRDGTSTVDRSYPYIPLPTVGREIAREVASLSAQEGFEQLVDGSRVAFIERVEDLEELPFFPNPLYNGRSSSVLSEVDPGIASLVDEAFDARHFMLRGAGSEPLDRGLGQGYFHGREREVSLLTDWLNGEGSGFRVVTGKPGVGKSGLLGVLVCAAHPQLRESARNLWFRLPVKPACNDRLAVVHARRRDLDQIADSVARQMGARDKDRPADGWEAEQLLRLAGPGGYTLVIDGLDEAERPDDITQALLLPLARAALAGHIGIRLLVGTRSEPPFTALLQLAQEADGLINLDHTQPDEIYQAVRRYVGDLLADDTPYAARDTVNAANALAEGIAERLTGKGDPTLCEVSPDEPKPLGWGEFLVAGLYLHHVLTLPTERDPGRARDLGLQVPRDLPDLLELDLARRADQPDVRAVLAAVAHARGSGMPERIIANAAAVFTHGTDALPSWRVQEVLEHVRFYLRQDIDTDGTTLYRLFHEGLAEHLRADPFGPQEQGQLP
ncbi:ATP-binding protein [Streptomyces viridochromogenes]|uniref:ATP-binding protein n=1 Tax=Streptomyces viridochromogenes TaxID=1938 RepID=UPI00069FA967|nr:ATP-binding protein [Streptomyces viridochromogenes]KOG19067.1 hypothetical protein ADK36_20735 [Streptomyces viridochromogenes]KOG19306.1 hypothetical protein ADK35_20595 [Streptomyces viridochromogenes]